MPSQHLDQAGRRAVPDQGRPAPAEERPREVPGSVRVAFKGFLEPRVVLEPARDLLSERLGLTRSVAAGRGAGQDRRQAVVARLARLDEQPPFLQAVEIIGRGLDGETLEQPDVDARRERRDRKDPPRSGALASDQIPREGLPHVAAAVPEAPECAPMFGGIQPFEPVQQQLQRGGPAPGQRPALPRQVVGLSAEPHPDQFGRLSGGEAQVGSSDLEQLTPPLRATEPQRRQAPAGQHKMELRRCLERQHPQQVARGLVVADALQAVDYQERLAVKRLGEFAQQRGTPFRKGMAVVGTGGVGDARAARRRRLPERGRDARRERLSLGIGGPQPDPASRAHRRDLRQGRGLPVTGARYHEGHPAVVGGGKQGRHPRPANGDGSACASRVGDR